ncbi:MAG TPA: hypothetical protein VM598_13525 [Bdellovibrionota bacterium]|nr:hypothetical protein [Bdellovibrionota bacterium]
MGSSSLPVVSAALAIAAGLALKGPPADPDVLMGRMQVVGSFLVFCGWAICLFSWGRLLARRAGIDRLGLGRLAPPLVLGSAALSLGAGALGTLGLIGYPLFPLHLALLFAGPLLELGNRDRDRARKSPKRRGRELLREHWPEAMIWAILAGDLASRLLRSSIANGTTDPHMYHLFAPRYWSELGRIDFAQGWPDMFHASHWEHLFIWGNSLLAGPAGRGLLEGQFFGQWAHLLGYVAALASLHAILLRTGVPRAWAAAGIVAAAGSQGMLNYTSVAKNGLGIAAWSLFSLLLLLPGIARTPAQLALGGALAGMAISGRSVAAFSVLPFLAAAWILRTRESGFARSLGQARWVFLGGLLGALPIHARNLWFTGNPLYPNGLHALTSPDWWSEPLQRNLAANLPRFVHSLGEAKGMILGILGDAPFNPLALVILPLALAVPRLRLFGTLLSAALATSAVFSSIHFLLAYLRWIAPSLFVVDSFAVAGLALIGTWALETRLVSRWLRSRRRLASRLGKIPSVVAVVVAAVCWSRLLPLGESWKFFHDGPSPTVVWRTPEINNGGDAKAWLRMNAKSGERVVSLGDRGYYPYYHLRPVSIFVHPVVATATDRIVDGRALVRRLRSYGFRWAIDVRHWKGGYFTDQGRVLDELSRRYPETAAYRGKDSVVIDLARLEERLEGGCVRGHDAPDGFLAL